MPGQHVRQERRYGEKCRGEVRLDDLSDQRLLAVDDDVAVRMLYTVTSFETYDTLAAPGQALTHVAPDVLYIAESVLSR